MYISLIKNSAILMCMFGVSSVSSLVFANYLTNYGEPNTAALTQAIANRSLHMVQLGDSHTAGDVMTEATRVRLQSALGDGGMGWAMPMYFSGQRMARFGYDNNEFLPISSRTTPNENYTLGGMIAKPKVEGAMLRLRAKNTESPQKFLVSIRQYPNDGKFLATDGDGRQFAIETPNKNGQWQMVSIEASLPLTLYNVGATNSVIGGWWAFAKYSQGAVVSALGINGAELSYWNRWNDAAWQNELAILQPQLIVLAYGTNEAYNDVSAQMVKSHLVQRIRQIRQVTPNSAVMILGAPEALKNTSGSCGARPINLTDIQYVQRQVAQSERTLYWDWQGAMGGSCSMKSWITSGKANRDGVHFTKSGYQILGNQLAQDILALNTYQPSTPTNSTSNPNSANGRGFIRIERAR